MILRHWCTPPGESALPSVLSLALIIIVPCDLAVDAYILSHMNVTPLMNHHHIERLAPIMHQRPTSAQCTPSEMLSRLQSLLVAVRKIPFFRVSMKALCCGISHRSDGDQGRCEEVLYKMEEGNYLWDI